MGRPYASACNKTVHVFGNVQTKKAGKVKLPIQMKSCALPCHIIPRFIIGDALLSDLMQGSNS